jgi:TRAP transporter TAXI family solute receptor
MRSRKSRSVLVMVVVTILLAACDGSAGSPPTRLTIGSGQEGSTFASYGEAMKAVLGSSLSGYRMVITPSNGSPENVRLLERDPSAIGLVHSGVASDAILGRGQFKQPVPDLRVLANLYTSYIHVVTLPDRNIRSFRDLKGKRVSVGSKGTGTEIDAMQLLAVFGFDPARALSFRFKPVGMLGAHQPRSAGVEAGWAGQAALVVVGRFFLGFLVGFLIAG